MFGAMRILFWRTLALAALTLALLGAVLPGLPTTPFVLVAAWGGGRGWPALERWLLRHPVAGPAILDWRERQVIPRGAKWAATLMMALSLAVLTAVGTAPAWTGLVAFIMLCAGGWIWTRPEGSPADE